jgi:tRNA A-37 threonylcarbamoyl transferase component Bud32
MAFVEIHPEYQSLLERHGLTSADEFLDLAGVIYCGHPDRHVARVTLGQGPNTFAAFVKKELRVPWRDRLSSVVAGFGLASKSRREKALHIRLARAGIASPVVLAAGEKGGRAFLLTREIPGAVDLRRFLESTRDHSLRRQMARQLGTEIARIHAAGLAHRDLYSKHILIQSPGDGALPIIWFLDWQRSRAYRNLSRQRRSRDLAATHATLAAELASPRERLECLRAYLRACRIQPCRLASWARRISRLSAGLLKKRHIRELLRPPLAPGTQNLIWLDGEALCVTREFDQEFQGRLPSWLPRLPPRTTAGRHLHEMTVPLPEARLGRLSVRRESRPLRWLWSRLCGRRPASPELQEAANLFRLQRFGLPAPRLLAVGQRQNPPWRCQSFLLTEADRRVACLMDWLLGRECAPLEPDHFHERRRLVQQAADIVRRIHEAGFALPGMPELRGMLGLREEESGERHIVVQSAAGLRAVRRPRPATDLARLHRAFGPMITRTDAVRFLLGYMNKARMDQPARQLLKEMCSHLAGGS